MRLVIIGNSATAVGAIESIRQHDQAAEILAISEEPHIIYSRPLLSHYLASEIDKARLAYRGADFYTRHHVQPILETRVEAIDTAGHALRTAKGDTYTYDKLLIATGGSPIVPPIPGLNTQGVFAFTRLDDAQGILQHIQDREVKQAVVVGGGMIGIKATDALLKRGLQVTLVELAPRILSAALDEVGSEMLASLLREAHVEVLTDNTVTAVQSDGGAISAVELRDGRTIPCELLVFGIGVRPNAELARAAGIAVNRGIIVDVYMRTSAPDVYAAGDVAEAYDLVVDMNRTVAIWPNAYRQGAIAGAHMVGVERADQGGVAMNAVEVCGVPAMSIGNGNVSGDAYEILMEIDERRNHYKRLVLQGDRLVGAVLVGNINRAGIYTGLIRARMDISACRKSLLN
jgi:NAD(P)H-nitrite reductase large subunit